MILQLIDTLKGVANPLYFCLSCSFNIPSLASGQRLCFRASSLSIENYHVFKLSCSRILPRRHILVFPRSNLVTNEDYTIIGNRGGVFISFVIRVVLPFIWISRLVKTQRTGSTLVLMVY